MDQTSRAVAVLAVSALLLAPLVNGVLEEAAATADRVFLKETDWNADPPEDPPQQEPPEEINQTEGNLTGPSGASPNCSITERWGPRWVHRSMSEDPQAGASNRSTDPIRKTFEITENDVAFGGLLNVTDLRGVFSMYVYPEGQDRESGWHYEKRSNPFEADVEKTHTTRRPDLSTGTWVAELNYRSANYDSLQFLIRIASCAEASQ